MTFDVGLLVVTIAGKEIAKLSKLNNDQSEIKELINKIRTSTGLELVQVLSCVQHCMRGKSH